MGVMEAIKKGFGIASKNVGLIAILFAFNLIFNLISIPFAGQTQAPRPELAAAAVGFSIIFILISIYIQSGALALVRDYIKSGKLVLANFFKYGLSYYVRLFGLGLLIVLVIAIIGLIAALVVMATAPLNNAIVTIIAAVIAITIGAIGLYYVLLLVMAPYIIVCEEKSIIEAVKRSIRVVRRSIGQVLLLLVLLILISLGLGFMVGFLTGLIAIAVPAAVGQVIVGIVNSVLNSYLGIVMMASFMVFYMALSEKEKTLAQKVF